MLLFAILLANCSQGKHCKLGQSQGKVRENENFKMMATQSMDKLNDMGYDIYGDQMMRWFRRKMKEKHLRFIFFYEMIKTYFLLFSVRELEKNECPLMIQREWPSTSAGKLELRNRNGHVIAVGVITGVKKSLVMVPGTSWISGRTSIYFHPMSGGQVKNSMFVYFSLTRTSYLVTGQVKIVMYLPGGQVKIFRFFYPYIKWYFIIHMSNLTLRVYLNIWKEMLLMFYYSK